MPEPEHPSRWTPDLLYEHLMRIMDERHAQYAERFESSQHAINKANEATQIRFETVNEWRALVQGMIDELMKRAEALNRLQQLSDRIDSSNQRFSEQIDSLETQFSSKIESIEKQLAVSTGTRMGTASSWGTITGAIVVVGVIVAIILGIIQALTN